MPYLSALLASLIPVDFSAFFALQRLAFQADSFLFFFKLTSQFYSLSYNFYSLFPIFLSRPFLFYSFLPFNSLPFLTQPKYNLFTLTHLFSGDAEEGHFSLQS